MKPTDDFYQFPENGKRTPETKLTVETTDSAYRPDSLLSFHHANHEVLRITHDGRMICGEGLSTEEATQEAAKLLIASFDEQIQKMVDARVVNLRADLERFTGHGLLDCHAICDQRDAAVAERDQLRAEVERLTKHCSALEVEVAVLSEGLSEDHAIYIANARAEKAEADLAAMTTCAKKLNEECELWEIRCGSIICSGVLDSYTGADLQKWEHEFKKKRGDLIARAEKAEADTARLDWLDENMRYSGGGSGGTYTFFTPADVECGMLRDAIDAAMKEASK